MVLPQDVHFSMFLKPGCQNHPGSWALALIQIRGLLPGGIHMAGPVEVAGVPPWQGGGQAAAAAEVQWWWEWAEGAGSCRTNKGYICIAITCAAATSGHAHWGSPNPRNPVGHMGQFCGPNLVPLPMFSNMSVVSFTAGLADNIVVPL